MPLNADNLNRTVFISDNLPFLMALDTESIDLVVIDPPFGKKQTFTGNLKPPLSALERKLERELMDEWRMYDAASAYELGVEFPDQTGQTALFREMWRFERVLQADWWEQINDTPVWWLIESTRRTHGEDTAAYIAFMAQRIIEIRRILKSTGSVYLHCDHDANAYLRQLMDAVFGPGNFRNEIAWAYTGPSNTRRWFPRKHDTILFYAKSNKAVFNRDAVRVPYNQETLARRGRVEGARSFISPSVETDGRRSEKQVRSLFGQGKVPESWWDDIPALTNQRESTGYPTQKPQALARRIIEVSSNPGDIVMDCFAGCAYVPVAAEESGRRWVACDMSPRAWTVVRRQFAKKPELGMTVEGDDAEYEEASPRFEGKGVLSVRGPNQLPVRTDGAAGVEHLPPRRHPIPEIRFRQKPLETGEAIWRAFVEQWGTDCWYCGRRQDADRRVLQLDHVAPNKGDGTNDDCWNRALACVSCNSDKGDRLNATQAIDKALAEGRIQTQAQRDAVVAAFSVRRQWARNRYEEIRKAATGLTPNPSAEQSSEC